MKVNRLRVFFIMAVGIAIVGGCGHPAQGPQATLDAYSNALRNRNYELAYELMSESFRNQYSKEDFVRVLNERSMEVDTAAEQLRGSRQNLEVSAEFQYDVGHTMRLTYEDNEWRVASNPLAFYSQATPRQALISFLLAYRLERWEIMLKFIPDKYRERMDVATLKEQFRGENRSEIEMMMQTLRNHVNADISIKGNEARMPYGDRYELRFVREQNLWKILDFD